MDQHIFKPSADLVQKSNIFSVMQEKKFSSYVEFYDWSINDKAAFIEMSLSRMGVKFNQPYESVLEYSQGSLKADWLEGAKLNVVESCFSAGSDKTALIFKAEGSGIVTLSYGELEQKVLRVANGLKESGFKKGQRCVLYMPMNVTSVVLYLALIAAGMVVVLVPDSFSAEELQKRIEIVGAEVVFACDEYIYNQKVINLKAKLDAVRNAKIYLADGKDCTGEDFGFREFWSNREAGYEYADVNEYISILFSSGTTKDPKAIPWKQLTPLKCAMDGFYHQDIKAGDVVTWTTGMGWMMAPWLFFATLINGATLAIYQGAYQTEEYGEFVQEAGVSILGVIPSLVKVWKNSGVMEQFDWNIRVFSSTGEPSNDEDYLYLQSLSKLQAPVIEYCGGTEIGGAYIASTVVEPSLISAFSTPTLGTELEFLKDESGCIFEVMIVMPAFGLSDELLNYEHDNEYFDARRDLVAEKVLRIHGDVYEKIEIDGKFYYRSRGRADDTFNLNGIKVSAVEIEQLVAEYEGLLEVAAVSYANGGPESLVIFYCSENDFDEQDLVSELQGLISKKLNPLYRLSRVIKVNEMPRTASNKLMRKELRKLLV
jgi:acetyl-CoA synthetase